MSWKKVRMFMFCCIAFLCLQGAAMPTFAVNEVYAIQVGTVYYEATSAGVQASDTVVAKNTITHLFADASVVQVGREDERFIGCTNLQVVDFSSASSLKIIYSETFRNCTSLHTVILPSGVNDIQAGAFRGCTALTSIDLSGTAVTTITNHTFNGCTSLQTVVFPAALTSIEYYAFYNCTALVLGDALQGTALKTIGNHAFYGCTSIVSVSMPSTLSGIESNAFSQCGNFSTLALGTNPPSVSVDAFTNCSQLFVLAIDEAAIASYQAVNDGDATDLYWYGWLIDQIDVTSQLSLSISGWTYKSGGAPSPSLTNNGTAVSSDVTYLYATSQNGTYQSAAALPRSSAGEIEAGTYWCMAVYDAARECGTVSKEFTVAQKQITATLWVLGITKVYDGTTTITGLQPTIVMDGALSGDDVTTTGSLAYASADAGTSKKITASDLVLSGADAANYILSATSASETGAEITQASVSVPPPTASDIDKGDTLDDSTLTDGDGTQVPGSWEWVDDTTTPEETGSHPAVFTPDDDNYATYGPVQVEVTVRETTTAGSTTSSLFSSSGDDTSSGNASSGVSSGDASDGETSQEDETVKSTGVWANLLSALFGGTTTQDADTDDAAQDDTDAEDDTIAGDDVDATQDADAADTNDDADADAATGHWALVNLLLCAITLAIGLVRLAECAYLLYENRAQAEKVRADGYIYRGKWRRWSNDAYLLICSGVLALASIICFFVTQQMLAPRCLVDRWTVLMLLFAAAQIGIAVYQYLKNTRRKWGH